MLSPVVNTVPEMLSRTCAVASSFPYDSQRATSPAPTSTTVVPDAVTVTVAVWAIAVPLAVAETVFVLATVELNVPVATPLPSVGPLGCVTVLRLPLADSTTVALLIGFPFASFAVTVIVALPLPAVIELGDAATVDCDADTGPGFTVTEAIWVMAVPFAVAETVFTSATVELSVPVATPLVLVGALGWVRVLPLPVAASTTVAALIGFPLASWTVTVMVEFPLPAASDVGEALTVDTEAETVEPAVTVTVAVWVTAVPLIVADTVFASATVELKVPVATPLALVGPLGWVSVLPLPVAASTTVAPLIGFPFASFAVTVIVALPLPAVIELGDAATVDCAAETGPGFTVTAAVWVMAVPFAVAETVFVPAPVALSVPVATPLALVGPLGWVRVLPLPVAESTTVAPLIGFPLAFLTVTVIVEFPLPAVSDVGEALTLDREGETVDPEPGFTVIVAVWLIKVPFAVAEIVFDSATVELNVPLVTPLLLVGPGCVNVLPLPVAESTTVAPPIGLPLGSFTVTVTVAVLDPAGIDVGEAVTVDSEADTTTSVTVTVAVWLTAVPLIVAETVLVSFTVEPSVPVATPLALVVPLGWVSVLPLPVAASTTVAPLIGFPLASFAVTVIVDVPVPTAMVPGEALTVDWEADTGPAVTVTAAVCVIAVPLAVAETVLIPATVELSVPVATPLAFVVPLGWVSVLPLPVAASATVAPLIGLPLASFAVTEIVDVPVPTGIELGEATTVDCEAETGPGLTVTDAVCVIAVPFAVAETVFVPAPVELSVPVATPLAFVVPLGWVRVLLLPVAASTTVAPLIGLPPASFTVTVIVALPLPAVIEVGEAATVESEAETAPAVTVTAAVWVIAVPLAVAETVLVSSTVELRVPVATPLALVVPLGCVRVLPLPVAASTTVAPLIGFPFASFAVTVIVDVPPTAMDVGEAATVDCEAETEPDVTVTVAVCVTALPLIVAETVFVPATVELSVPVATPLALVVPLGCDNVLPLPVAASTTVAPLIGFPFASFAVTVIVAVPPTPM